MTPRSAGASPGDDGNGGGGPPTRDGDTWRERNATALGDGHYRVQMDQRSPKHTSGYVSLRVEARDANGGRIEQEITRAYGLTPRD